MLKILRWTGGYFLLLTLAISDASAQPKMFWFNDPVGPNETVIVTGANLDEITGITVTREPEAGTGPVPPLAAEILQANALSLKFVVPATLAPGVFTFTLNYRGGSASGRLNKPTAYWTQGDRGNAATPEGWIQVFGRNIVRRPDHAFLTATAEDGTRPITLKLEKGDLWRASFRVPPSMPAGRYALRLFNGDGNRDTATSLGSMTVESKTAKTSRLFDVRAYGANGDGRADSTHAVKAAINAAKESGGGVVYFPRGRYALSGALLIPPDIKLRGERTDLVNLTWPDFADPPPALIQGTSRFAVEDMTLYASNHHHVISGGFVFRDAPAPDAGDITIARLRIRASAFRGLMDIETTIQRMRDFKRLFPDAAPDTIRLSGDRVTVVDCDVLGSGHSLRLVKATNAVVAGNTLINGRDGNYTLLGSRRVIFENNIITAADLQATGGGITTLSRTVSSSENIFIANNRFAAFYGSYREAMTTDGPGGYYFGHADSKSSTELRLRDARDPHGVLRDWKGAAMMVVNGRGAGQYARIVATSGGTQPDAVTLDRELGLSLDETSEIAILQAHENYLVIDNSFEDAGVGAQSFGTAIGHVFAGNRSRRTSGFAAVALSYGHPQPCWHIQFLDNHITEGNVYRAGPDENVYSNEALIFIRANQSATAPGRPPLIQGVVLRGNRLDEDAHIRIEGFSAASPGIRDVVIEGNTSGPSRVGTVVDRGVAFWLSRNNIDGRRIGR